MNRVDPTSDLYLKSEGHAGSPNDSIEGFEGIFNELNLILTEPRYHAAKDHPLYNILSKYSQAITPGSDLEHAD